MTSKSIISLTILEMSAAVGFPLYFPDIRAIPAYPAEGLDSNIINKDVPSSPSELDRSRTPQINIKYSPLLVFIGTIVGLLYGQFYEYY